MTIDLESLQEFTDAELLLLTRRAIAEHLAHGRLVTIREKSFQGASLQELQDLEANLTAKISAGSTPRRATNYLLRS